MRVDTKLRLLHIGVRDLVGQEEGRWDIVQLPGRAEIGRAMHERRRSFRGLDEPTFQSEVHVTHQLTHRDYTVVIRGRLDGLYQASDAWVIEEFKSLAMEPPELAGLTIHELPGARMQLGLYLFFLAEQGREPLRGELVVGSIFDPDVEYVLPVAPFHEEVRRFLAFRLDTLLDVFEARERWWQRRRAVAEVLPFPHPQLRDVQKNILQELQTCFQQGGQILVEAPTGTGKTAVSLFAALKLAYQYDKRVALVTAKTSGQNSARETLLRLAEQRIPLRSLVLTARDKICPQPVVYCHPQHCAYADRFPEKLRQSQMQERLLDLPLLDRSSLTEAGDEVMACPFELSLLLLPLVDVVVCDYNYVFDPTVRLEIFDPAEGAGDWILIIDEAHNLPARARDYFSPLLSYRALQLLASWGEQRRDNLGARVAGLAAEIQSHLWDLADQEGLLELAEGRVTYEPDLGRLVGWQQTLASLMLDDPLRRRGPPLPGEEDLLLACYRQLTAFTRGALGLDETSSCFLERSDEELRLRILCHDASRQLRQTLEGFHAVAAMSATLSPGTFYRDLLGLRADAPVAVFPSPFSRAQRGVFVVDDVPDRYREREASLPRLCEILEQVLRARRGAYALYLPSYEFIQQLRPPLERAGFELLVQDARMDDAMRGALLARLAEPLAPRGLFRGYEGRLLVAVQGGSFAEGIEWPSGVLSGLIVVSPGLPRMSFENQLLRHYYDEQQGAGFEYAYLYPGMAKVIQAAGRLIRRDQDRGVIVLVGARFSERRYSRLLPRDWYDSSPEELVVQDLPEALARFWAQEELSGTSAL